MQPTEKKEEKEWEIREEKQRGERHTYCIVREALDQEKSGVGS